MSYGYTPGGPAGGPGDPDQPGQPGAGRPGGYPDAGGYGPPQGGGPYGGAYPPGPYGGYGQPAGPGYGGPPPNNWLIPSILTFLCCGVFAVIPIIFAAQVNSKWSAGDYEGARTYANRAKTISIIFYVIGAIMAVIWITTVVAGVIGSSHTSTY